MAQPASGAAGEEPLQRGPGAPSAGARSPFSGGQEAPKRGRVGRQDSPGRASPVRPPSAACSDNTPPHHDPAPDPWREGGRERRCRERERERERQREREPSWPRERERERRVGVARVAGEEGRV